MTRRIVLPVVIALVLVACGSSHTSTDIANADSAPPPALAVTDPVCPDAGEEWEVAKLYIEHNATDADTGVHGLLGGEAWRFLCVFDPDGNQIWSADPQGQLGELGVADFFFESREPEAAEYSVADLRSDFPEGMYRVAGTDYNGVARVGEALFSHDIPAEPIITNPPLSADPEELGDVTVPAEDLIVRWEPVTETVAGGPVEITAYEVIVTDDDHEDPHGLSRPVYDVHVPAEVTELPVPAQFLRAGVVYELEVLALELTGNQTIGLGFFAIE